MRKNEYTKNYDMTIVGGGLAGKLMLAVIINSGLFDENKLCWINTDNENYKDVRVSFINHKNFLRLKSKHLSCQVANQTFRSRIACTLTVETFYKNLSFDNLSNF